MMPIPYSYIYINTESIQTKKLCRLITITKPSVQFQESRGISGGYSDHGVSFWQLLFHQCSRPIYHLRLYYGGPWCDPTPTANHISALAQARFLAVLRQSLELSDMTQSNQQECFQQYSPITSQE